MAIFKKNGKWWIGYPLGDGKYRREVVGASHALAKQALAKRQAEATEEKFFPDRHANKQRFADILKKYWELHGRLLRSRSWFHVSEILRQRWGERAIGVIGATDIQGYYNEVCERASPSTANRHLSFIRLVFNKARKWGDFNGENPCSRVDKKR